jgi:outer membrane receptor protein involved in Fe transport
MVILATARASGAHAADAEEPAASDDAIADVIVTAQRRSESIQNVPITIQAITSESIKQLNVQTFDDYVKFLPNVTGQGLGPGQNNVYMRGLSTGVTGIQGSGVVGSFPNVAIYLDDQSGQVPGRNLDIYAADLERIEVLEGPQGTLFGAGAQAGVVRYITNKPKLDRVEANFSAGYATTADGEDSNSLEGVINLPIITDKFAMRGVVYNESRGGYIDNIPGVFTRKPTDLGVGYQYGACPPPPASSSNCPSLSNSNIVGRDINPVVYKGLRISALWQFNDDWNVLVTQNYQHIDADGVFAEQEVSSDGVAQPDRTVQLYNPSWNKDKFRNTSWTLNGRLGMLKAVYTGGYLTRDVEQVQDYTNYARGPYMNYYQCVSAAYTTDGNARCFSPSATWHDIEKNTHQAHELRFSTPDDKRVRAIGGLFWERYKIEEQVDWHYKSAVDYFRLVAPPLGYFAKDGNPRQGPGDPSPGRTWSYRDFLADPANITYIADPATALNPNARDPTIAFFDDITRGYTQKAAFASIDFDVIPEKLTLTAGTRYYRINSTEVGSAIGSFGCKLFTGGTVTPGETCTAGDGTISPVSNGGNLDSLGYNRTYKGFKSRINLSYRLTDSALVYATWSQGFRSGGFNRPNAVESGSPLASSPEAIAHGGFAPPVEYKPDVLINNELGWKTEFLNRRVQFNGAIYKEEWKNAQIAIFDPGVTGNLTFSANGGTFEVKGVETSIAARITPQLTVTAGGSYNDSELTKVAGFNWSDGTPIDFSMFTDANGNPLSTPGGDKGSPLSSSPKWQGNLRVRYDFNLAGYDAFWQVAGVHQGSSLSTTDRLTLDLQGNSIAYKLPSYELFDASVGVSKDAWSLTLYGQNLADKQAALYSNARQWYKATTMTRPRTLGLRFGYTFSGK